MGRSVASAGDVNNDGFDDVIVGAPHYDNGDTDEGRVYVYHGTASGPSTSANWVREIDSVLANFGSAVAPASDINRDGYDDVIVGAFGVGNQEYRGKALIYVGGPSGIANTEYWSTNLNQAYAGYGNSVGTFGGYDVNGYASVFVTAFGFDHLGGQGNNVTDEGAVFGLPRSTEQCARPYID